MTLEEMEAGAEWMTRLEKKMVAGMVSAFRALLAERKISENIALALRVDDICSTLVLVRRIEAAVPKPGETPEAIGLLQAVEAAGKARERWRKAMNELDELLSIPAGKGGAALAGAVQDIMELGKGTVEAVLEEQKAKAPARKRGAAKGAAVKKTAPRKRGSAKAASG